MTTSPYPRQGGDDGADRRITVNAGRLWTGGLATAVVAALVAVVGVLFARGLFDVPVLAPTEEGTPQGGVVSPLLMNIALHGMETAAGARYRTAPSHRGWSVPGTPVSAGFPARGTASR